MREKSAEDEGKEGHFSYETFQEVPLLEMMRTYQAVLRVLLGHVPVARWNN